MLDAMACKDNNKKTQTDRHNTGGEGKVGRDCLPSLARTALVAGHMAAPAVETGMVDLAPLCALFLLGSVVVVVVARRAFRSIV